MPRTPRFQDDDEFGDGSRYEMVAWSVPTSSEYPEGIRYGFQYMTADGTTLLRYDNYTDTETPARVGTTAITTARASQTSNSLGYRTISTDSNRK